MIFDYCLLDIQLQFNWYAITPYYIYKALHSVLIIVKFNNRFTFSYDAPIDGEGRFLHTYAEPSDPLKSFEGEPKRVDIKGNIDEFTDSLWNALNEDNKISLFVRFIDIATGKAETKIINKYN